MNKSQSSKREMFQRVILFFGSHPALEAALPRLQSALQEFKTNQDLIEAASEGQQVDIKAVTQGKEDLFKKLGYAFDHLAKAIRAYAFDRGLVELGARYAISRTRLMQSRDSIMVDTIDLLTTEASALPAQLGDYGYTVQDYTALQQLLTDVKASQPVVSTTADSKKSATRNLSQLLRRNMELLQVIIGPIMLSMRFSNPAVYEDYRIARKIMKKGGKEEVKKDTGEK